MSVAVGSLPCTSTLQVASQYMSLFTPLAFPAAAIAQIIYDIACIQN